MAPCTLVASTTSSRRPLMALPTMTSDSPPEYTSAVSMKFTPASSAALMMAALSSWSGLPQAPNIMAPRHSGLTFTPVRPKVRYFTCVLPHPVDLPGHPSAQDVQRSPTSRSGRAVLPGEAGGAEEDAHEMGLQRRGRVGRRAGAHHRRRRHVIPAEREV